MCLSRATDQVSGKRRIMTGQDTWYPALLGLADSYLKANNIKECVRCLSAVFNFSPPPMICARTHLQLGNILHTKTNNLDLAKQHLYQAGVNVFLLILIKAEKNCCKTEFMIIYIDLWC